MRQHLSRWHRRLGVFAASIAIYLSLTGILLNHSDDLGLNETRISNNFLLKLYGIKSPTGRRADTRQFKVDKIGTALFLSDRLLGQFDAPLIGAVPLEQVFIIGLKDSILLLNYDGELIETLTRSGGLPGHIDRLGKSATGLIIKSGAQLYQSDTDILNWSSAENINTRVSWSELEPIPPGTEARLLSQLPAYGPSWERVLQDLHSGRLFGTPGTLLIDLTGIVLLLLSVSGIISFTIRKKAVRQNRRSQ